MTLRTLVESALGERMRRDDHSDPTVNRPFDRGEQCLGNIQDTETFDNHPPDTVADQRFESRP